MINTTRRSTAGIVLLLVGLSLTMAVTLIASHTVRANPGVLYAAPTAQGSGDCSSWDNTCTLKVALAASVSGDEIWVQTGVHYPGTSFDDTFTLKNGVALYGGFAGTETSRDERDWKTNLTILSGDIDHNDINTDGNYINETWNEIQGYNAYHVVTGGGTDDSAVLDGFIITAGHAFALDYPAYYGGGMYNYISSPRITNVTFSGNYARYSGGGMYNSYSSPTLTNITFTGNWSSSGGGMLNLGSSPTLSNVTLSGNSASSGGGMYNDTTSSPTLINVTLSGNSATNNGGGMFNLSSSPHLKNVIMWANTAMSDGSGIYNSGSTPTIAFSDIQACGGSGADWNYGCGSDGGGNIEADPRFMDAANGNLRLQADSPCIDAGDNTAVPSGVLVDLDGYPRFVDVRTVPDTGNGTPPIVDMGVYENQGGNLIFLPLVLRN